MVKKTAKLKKQLDRWCTDNRVRHVLYERALVTVEEANRSPSRVSVSGAVLALSQLSSYYGGLGLRGILAGSGAGWDQLEASLELGHWNIRLQAETAERWLGNPNVSVQIPLSEAGLRLCHSLSVRYEDGIRWLGAHVDSPRARARFLDSHRPFAVFVGALYGVSCGSPPGQLAKVVPPPYAAVLESWTEPAREFSTALQNALDYHLEQTTDCLGELGEFIAYPYALLPVEYLAIAEVRKRSGMAMPAVDHPLVALGISSLPEWSNTGGVSEARTVLALVQRLASSVD